MFETQTKTFTNSWRRERGKAVCDRCGHVMDETDHRSGYNNLTMLRFRAGYDSKFGDGNLIEGDFCDACLFELVARYVRVVTEPDATPDSGDCFRFEAPKRLYAECQLDYALADGLLESMRGWIKQAFAADLARKPLLGAASAEPTDKPPTCNE